MRPVSNFLIMQLSNSRMILSRSPFFYRPFLYREIIRIIFRLLYIIICKILFSRI